MSPDGGPSTGLRWTPRAWLFLGTGTALLVLAIAARNPVPVFVALPLLVAPLAAAVTGPPPGFRASFEWGVQGSGTEVRVSGQIRAEGVAHAPELHVLAHRPGDLVGPENPAYTATAAGVEFTYRWTSPRPTIAIVPPPAVVWQDPLGLVQRLATGDRSSLVVERSPLGVLRMGAIRLDRTLPLPGETRSRRIGSSGEFYGIREAQPSDPPRRINWLASARAGRRLTNEFELDRTGDIVLLLDTRPTPLGAAIDDRLLGVGRAAAVGLAEAFLREKDRVGYASFGEFMQAVPLAGGRHQAGRIQAAILATERAAVPGPTERCAVSLGRYFPRGITVLLISSLAGAPSAELVPYLTRRGYPVVVLSPSPLGLASHTIRLDPADETLARRIDRVERQTSLGKTWVHAPVIDWEDYWSLGRLVRFLQQPRRRRSA